MILKIRNKPDFVNKFLSPVSKINDSSILKLTNKGFSTLMSAADNTVILYGQYDVECEEVEGTHIFNLPDLNRLIKILQCIEKDNISLQLESNHIKYSSSDVRFKYHLLDDGILSAPPVSVDKIKQTVKNYNASFKVPYTSLINLIKNGSFALDINKVYLFSKNGEVYAEIDDKERHNVDSFCMKLCNGIYGDEITEPLPISFETIRVLAGTRCEEVAVYVNTELNVLTFEVNTNDVKMTYIVSGLSK